MQMGVWEFRLSERRPGFRILRQPGKSWTIIPQEDSIPMWPLNIVLLIATAARPVQQPKPLPSEQEPNTLMAQRLQHAKEMTLKKALESPQERRLCFAIRSYHFRRQDGQAPVLVGTTTCTPAIDFRQRQVSPAPKIELVPLGLQPANASEPQ